MRIDFLRNMFEVVKHYGGVEQKQGRVQQDNDWNRENNVRSAGIADVPDEFVTAAAEKTPGSSPYDSEWKYVPVRRTA